MLFLTFSPLTSLRLCYPPYFSPFALPYIVLAISQSTNGSYSSISGGDPGPLGERRRKPTEYRKAFYLFILFCLPHVSIPLLPLFISPPLSPALCLCPWRLSESRVHAEWSGAASLPIAAYANKIIKLTDYVASLTHLHLPVLLSSLCQPIQCWPWLGKFRDVAVEKP